LISEEQKRDLGYIWREAVERVFKSDDAARAFDMVITTPGSDARSDKLVLEGHGFEGSRDELTRAKAASLCLQMQRDNSGLMLELREFLLELSKREVGEATSNFVDEFIAKYRDC